MSRFGTPMDDRPYTAYTQSDSREQVVVQTIPVRSSRMCCCHILTGGAIIGTIQAVILMAMLSGAAITLDRWRFWERLPFDPDWQSVTLATTTPTPMTPYSYQFPSTEEVDVGWTMTVTGSVKVTGTTFTIDLNCGIDSSTDVPFHFNPRFADPIHVARNTRQTTVWDTNEEQDGGMGGLAQGASFVIKIEVFATYYEVSIGIGGAALSKFIRYNHRTPYACISSVSVTGDIDGLFGVSYYFPSTGKNVENFAEAWLEFALAHQCAFLAVWMATLFPFALSFVLFEPLYILPNLAMIGLSLGSSLLMIVAIAIRYGWPDERYQTDEIQEAVMMYMLIFLVIWWFVMVAFGLLIYKFYMWMGDEQRPVVFNEEVERPYSRDSFKSHRY